MVGVFRHAWLAQTLELRHNYLGQTQGVPRAKTQRGKVRQSIKTRLRSILQDGPTSATTQASRFLPSNRETETEEATDSDESKRVCGFLTNQ